MRRASPRSASRLLAPPLLLALAWLAPPVAAPALAQPEQPVTLSLKGDESADTVRRLVEALSTGGRRVEVRVADRPAPPPADVMRIVPRPSSVHDT